MQLHTLKFKAHREVTTVSEKMLLTQALDERDSLKEEIRKLIENTSSCFVDVIRENDKKTYKKELEEEAFITETKELYERIQARIKRYYAIEKGILASNASNIISTQIGDMTITGAISLRNRLRGKGAYGRTGLFEKNLEEEMEQELARYEKRCANQNELLSDRAAKMRLSILGKDNKGKQDQFLDVVEAFLKENTVELVDPLHIKKCSEANAARRDELLTELDTKIKVSNATVFVEIEE